MQISFAHLRERSTTGHPIDFAVFGACSNSRTQAGNSEVLDDLTMRARASGLKIDQSALAYQENGRTKFYGSSNLVDYLSKHGVPRWTHTLDV